MVFFQHQNGQKWAFSNTSLDFFASYLQYGMCSAEKSHSLNLGTWNFPSSVVLNLSLILLFFWSLKNEQSHKSAIFSCTKPKWAKKDENMYEVYRKYKKNGFRNTLKMTKMCLLWGTVPPLPVLCLCLCYYGETVLYTVYMIVYWNSANVCIFFYIVQCTVQ